MENQSMASSKPRVLIAAGIYPPDPGGPAVHAKAQFEGFPELGVKTRLVAFSHYRKWPKVVRHMFYFFALLSKAPGCDVVYAHDAISAGIPAMWTKQVYKKKLILRIGGDVAWERSGELQGLSMIEWYEQGFYKDNKFFKLSQKVLQGADVIIVVSALLTDIYTKYYGVNPLKIKVIANPVPEVSGRETKIENNIVYASRLVSYKNLELVLKVLAKVFPAHPELKFIIMGDGPERKKLEAITKDLNIGSQVVFTGTVPQSQVLEETSSCLFTLAPALTEFNPNYVLQGISLGKPTIISRENGLPFSVPTEFSFSARDEAGLESCIMTILDPGGYQKAIEWVRSLNFKMGWSDNLKANVEAIKSL